MNAAAILGAAWIWLVSVDWPVVLPIILGALTLGLVVIQLCVMRRQTEIMAEQRALQATQNGLATKQLDLAETQAKLALKQGELLARRSDLRTFIAAVPQVSAKDAALDVLVRNHGNKSSRDFYWHIRVDARSASLISADFEGIDIPAAVEELPDGKYVHFKGKTDGPLYPTRPTNLCRVNLKNYNLGQFKLAWKLVDEDGCSPTSGQYETTFFRSASNDSAKTEG